MYSFNNRLSDDRFAFYHASVRRWNDWMKIHSESYWRTSNLVASQNALNDSLSSDSQYTDVDYDDQLSVDYAAFEALRNFREEHQKGIPRRNPEADVRLIDIRHANDSVTKASEKAPSEDTQYKLRQKRAEETYGAVNSMKILVMENEIAHNFQSFVDRHKPHYWPVIPFNL